jgi:hypothetical protein
MELVYSVEQRITWYGSIRLGRETLEELVAEARRAGALRPRDRGYSLQVPFGAQELEGIAARP